MSEQRSIYFAITPDEGHLLTICLEIAADRFEQNVKLLRTEKNQERLVEQFEKQASQSRELHSRLTEAL